jgi:hypothetical protein
VGLISIMAYSKILNENEILSFVNRFIPTVSQKIFLSSDESLIDLGVSVHGILVSLGGTRSLTRHQHRAADRRKRELLHGQHVQARQALRQHHDAG